MLFPTTIVGSYPQPDWLIDMSDMQVETPQTVVARLRRALQYVAPERIVVSGDCGMKYLPREVAFGKMQAMADGAALLRKEYG